MPEVEEQTPLLQQMGSPSLGMVGSSRRRSSSRWISTSSWGTVLKVETIYQPKPISPLSPRKIGVMLCLLMTALCERLSYYSVLINLVLFCTSNLHYTSTQAITISLLFSGTTYLTPIIGGYVADVCSGRYNAIYGSALVSFLGLVLLPCAAVDFLTLFGDERLGVSVEWRRAFFLAGLALTSVGTGGVKANLGLFGAHQVRNVSTRAVRTFFHWHYWFMNAGALLAYIGVAAVQQTVGFSWGYLIPGISTLTVIILFLLPRGYYRYPRPRGSVLLDSFKVCWQGCRRSSRGVEGAEGFFDTARQEFGGTFSDEVVEGVTSIVGMLPIFLCVVMYCAVYAQMQSTFFLQGERMDLHTTVAEIPVAMLNAFSSVALIVLIPLLDRVIYPCFQRLGCTPSQLIQIGIGFVLAALSMITAALVEIYRKEWLGFQQVVGNETVYAANVTVFLQVPQYTLLGISEAFTSIAGLELAYTQSPADMQGVMTGLYLATVGLGSYLACAVLTIVHFATQQDPWFPEEINEGHAEYYFFLLAGLMGVFCLAFTVAARLYRSRPVGEEVSSVGTEQSERESISQETASQETNDCAQETCSMEPSSVETSSSVVTSKGEHSHQNGRALTLV